MFTHGVDRKTGLPSCNIPRVSLPGQKLATLSISQQFVRNDARYLSHEVCATAIQLALSIKVIFVSAFQFLGLSIGFISRLLVRNDSQYLSHLQAGQWGFQYYRPPPHKTAIYRPIFNFSTVPFSPVKFFANTIETDNLENFLCTLYRD